MYRVHAMTYICTHFFCLAQMFTPKRLNFQFILLALISLEKVLSWAPWLLSQTPHMQPQHKTPNYACLLISGSREAEEYMPEHRRMLLPRARIQYRGRLLGGRWPRTKPQGLMRRSNAELGWTAHEESNRVSWPRGTRSILAAKL